MDGAARVTVVFRVPQPAEDQGHQSEEHAEAHGANDMPLHIPLRMPLGAAVEKLRFEELERAGGVIRGGGDGG